MLVNMESYGRLGNRLFLAAHLMAFSLRNEVPLLNLGFAEYAPWFPWLEGNAGFAYPWRETGGVREADRLRRHYQRKEWLPWTHRFRYWGDQDLDFDKTALPGLLVPLKKGRDVLLRSWLFRGYESLSLFRSEVLQIFQPPIDIVSSAETFIGESRVGVDFLVGVHVRWEDYRGTENFLDRSAFLIRLERFVRANPERHVRFVLFSNETLSAEGWRGLDVVLSPGTSPLFDLEAMSRCDLLMGPPSTFSGWASFVGGVPLEVLRASDAEPARKGSIVNG